MYLHRLEKVQVLPLTLDETWEFFSSPQNLDKITPDDLSFEIISILPPKMHAGMLIEYRLKLFGILPQSWVTEITQVEDRRFFIDEQRFGPYRLWHHQHHFRSVENGTEMRDILHYRLPLGWIGKITHELLVRHQVNRIFNHREVALKSIFSYPVLSPA